MTALMALTTVLRLAKVQVVLRSRGDHLVDDAMPLLTGGADLVEVWPRKHLLRPDKALGEAFGRVRSVGLPAHKLVVAGDPALGKAVEADVVQLDHREPTATGKASVQQYGLVGRTVHTEQQIRDALADDGIFHLVVQPQGGGLDLDLLRAAALLAPQEHPDSKPWFAGGDITPANLHDVLAAGAMRVSLGEKVTGADDAAAQVQQVADALGKAWADSAPMEKVHTAAFRFGS